MTRLVHTPGQDSQPAYTKRKPHWGVVWKSRLEPRVRPVLWGGPAGEIDTQPTADLALGSIRQRLSMGQIGDPKSYLNGTFYPVRLDLHLVVDTLPTDPAPVDLPVTGHLKQQYAALWKHNTRPYCRLLNYRAGFADSAEAILTKMEVLIKTDPKQARRALNGTFYPVWMNRVLEVAEVDSRIVEAGAS